MEAHSYRRSSNFKILAATVVLLIASRANAQNSEWPAYLDPALPAQQRPADLVHRMSEEEKVTQLTNQLHAIERLYMSSERMATLNWEAKASANFSASMWVFYNRPA